MRKTWVFISLLFTIAACHTNDDDSANLANPTFDYSDGIDRINLHISNAGPYTGLWSSTLPVDVVQNKAAGYYYFKIPTTSNGQETQLTLQLSNGNHTTSSTESVTVPAYSLLRAYGLGTSVDAEKSNGVDYEWYIDQRTGTYPAVDCGPTSVTMAIKWYNKNFTGTNRDARAVYNSSGGWWYTGDMMNYLTDKNTPYSVISLTEEDQLTQEIDNGNIFILCLDMFYVGNGVDDDYHYNKFYPTQDKGWGHFIVIKGYKKVETPNGTKVYMEAYDPYSQGNIYADNSFKGKDRYYTTTDLIAATSVWWQYAIVLSKDGNTGGRIGLNPADIPNQGGQ